MATFEQPGSTSAFSPARLLGLLAILLILLGGIFLSDRFARALESAQQNAKRSQLAELAQADQSAIQGALAVLEESLSALAAFQSADPKNSSGAFENLAANVLARNPSVRLIGRAERTSAAPALNSAVPISAAVSAAAAAPLAGALEINWLGERVPAGVRESYLPIKQLQLAANLEQAAKDSYLANIQLDLYADPEWQALLAKKQLGISYRSLEKGYALALIPHASGELIDAAIIVEVAVDALLAKSATRVEGQNNSAARIFDASDPFGLKLVFPTARNTLEDTNLLSTAQLQSKAQQRQWLSFNGLNRKWLVETEPLSAFLIGADRTPQYLRIGGIVTSALAALLLLNLVTRNARIEKLVQVRGQELSGAYEQLRDSELMTMQNEKMSSLGQMVAGVAHEINTPLAFATSNVELLKERMESVTSAVGTQTALMAQLKDWPALDQAVRNAWYKSAVDSIDSIQRVHTRTLGRSDTLLDESMEGLNRVRDLVATLKDFSRVDRAAVDDVDLHVCIENTLKIANNLVKNKADIVRDFASVPKVRCNPSQINQVLLNLISNAAQAIPEWGEIKISTRAVGENVEIEIADNGPGVPEAIRTKIFEPFFTTKGSGEGTGLGLAICQKIIQAHGGELTLRSKTGEGAIFNISLPIRADLKTAQA